ncbi:MAG: energy transducer TonB [Aquabacterium sp.]|jgi:protein TonB|uniref:energy transducer TonB n=1 Tax=Aquabacterium sp. TaxID=1872578 RepID=UPI002A35C2C6|nr:energy transducer TonB [Aquabacterium sp.]MDX9844222.1 energy transducer TonB [Aquabacterium sp.]
MTSFALPLQPQLLRPPVELTRLQRAGLAASVLVVHASAALVFWHLAPEPVLVAESAPITVALIADEPQTQAAQPPVVQPEPPKPVPVVQPRPTPPVPRPAPPLVAAPRPAAPQEMQVPVAPPTPPTPPKPVAPAEVAPAPAAAPATQAAPTGPVTAAPAGQVGRSTTQPKVLPSSAVRYLLEPMLSYPRISREMGEEGVVRLKVLVDEQGRPQDIEVARSSGYPRLDQQAVQAMKKARFQPHLEDGQARKVWVVAPLTFNLED